MPVDVLRARSDARVSAGVTRLFPGILHGHACQRPHATACVSLDDDGTERRLTYRELDARARAIAAALSQVCVTGEPVFVVTPPGNEFVEAFLGVLYAGAVAVPAWPPRGSRLTDRFMSVLQDASVRIGVTTSALLPRIQRVVKEAGAPRIEWICGDRVRDGLGVDWTGPPLQPVDPALLQYTSGSIANPRGVVVTHGHLVANSEGIRQHFEHTTESHAVIWLPPFHDMGLIGGILQPLYVGCPVTLLAPHTFLRRPIRWLEAISRVRGTTSGGPNFAFELCVERTTPSERASLDLSSWSIAFCGAEPIRASTVDRFVRAFSPHGFRRSAFYPCYGLAEATLMATGVRKGHGPTIVPVDAAALETGFAIPPRERAARLVGCGRAISGHEIAIVDSGGASCPDNVVGEVWISGPSVASGYRRRPAETEHVFRARLPERPGQTFLRTGDLGFLRDGELFVTGRRRELIIIAGRNHYPQDIEASVQEAHPVLKSGAAAAFGIDAGEERLVIVAEVDSRADPECASAIVSSVRRAVVSAHDVTPADIVLAPPGTVLRTSSGKVRRLATRERYVRKDLARWPNAASSAAADQEVSNERV